MMPESAPEFEFRLRLILSLFILAFGFLWIRLFHLQIVQGDSLRAVAEANRTTTIYERAPRGLILDQNGLVLADSRPTFVVFFAPLDLMKSVFQDVVRRLSRILDLPEEDLRRQLEPAMRHSSMVRVMDRASRSIAFALKEQGPNLPGVSVLVEMQRRYPNGALASHALGYLGQISPQELAGLKSEGYRADWLVGKMGLEKVYDRLLRGRHGGQRIEVDASGRSLKILDRREPVSGDYLLTTLNLKIQRAAEEALAEGGKPGAVVALDPRNGEVTAFASYPAYDPNLFLFTRGEETEGQIQPGELLTQKDLPLFNRALQGTYPPGSIFKIVDVAAALEAEKLRPEESFTCPGYFWLGGPGGKKFMCWKEKGHGRMDLKEALVNSCNVYFYHVGLKVGPDPIEKMAHEFGLGAPSGLEFPGEKSGLIPGRTMFKGTRRRWFDGDTLNMAIGQGTILFTPLQAAELASVVASRGRVYRPRLVREVRTPSGESVAKSAPELLREVRLSPATWDFIHGALTEVVERGTGQAAKIPGIKVAGKTGTAQNPHGKSHAWFIAFAPVEQPVIALGVLVEHGLKGSVAAAPVAKKVIEAALAEAGVMPQAGPAPLAREKEISGD